MEYNNKKAYDNAGYFFLILFVAVLIGFFKTYFGIFPKFTASIKNASVIHFHAAVATIWVILLVVQPILIRNKKYKIHRILGIFTYLLVPCIIGSFIALMYTKYLEANMGQWKIFDIILTFYFQVLHTIFFTVFYTLAIINKKKIALHAGYMLATGLIFVNPSVKRVFMNALGFSFTVSETIAIIVTDLIVIGLFFYAKKHNLSYKLYLIILTIFLFYHIPMFAVMYYFFPEV